MDQTNTVTRALEHPPLFIVGSGRSGTTLLYRMLSRHPGVYAPLGETNYFLYLPEVQRRFPDLGDDETLRALVRFTIDVARRGYTHRDRARTGERLEVLPEDEEAIAAAARRECSYEAVFRIVMNTLARLDGKARWIEKTPGHLLYVDAIAETFPGAVFVDIERDARAVLASHKGRRDRYVKHQRRNARGKTYFPKEYDPLRRSLEWKSAIRLGTAAGRRHGGRYLRITYEALVRDPEATLRRVCAHARLPYRDDLVDIGESNSSFDELLGRSRGVDTRSLEKWKEVLSPAEVALCQYVVRDELAEMGYAPHLVARRWRVAAPLLALKSVLELPAQVYRRWRYGGTTQMLAVFHGVRRRLRALQGQKPAAPDSSIEDEARRRAGSLPQAKGIG